MKTPRRTRTLRLAAAVASATVVFATMTACSSDDEDGSADGGTGADSTAAVPSGAYAGNAASGEPVKIGLITNEGGQAISQPETREAAEAATAYANANLGGIAGRPIELVVCKTQEEPTAARNCANQMVEQNLPAVVVTSTGLGSIINPIITGAGIPYATALGGSPAEIMSENSFVWTAGSNTTQAMAAYGEEQGWKTAVAYSIDSPAATGTLERMGGPAFRSKGMEFELITIPFGSPDATPQVSAGLDKDPQGVLVYGESTVCTSVLKALSTLGSTAQPMSPQTCAAPEVVSAVGPAAVEDMKIFSSGDSVSDNPESVLFREVMAEYAPDTPIEGFAVTGYQSMLGFVRAVEGLTGDVTKETVGDALRSATDVPLPAGDGITFTCNGTAIPGMQAICGNQMIVLTMKDGELTNPEPVSVVPPQQS
ncbi:ABC transporter substrate-binding protein [Gordonia sp. HNM0687]|uniref:ABC transporter substrate-binding protein n=1 Tax=Gordonia mangrovi TaxID=2665643 RepID=A0A6L7GV55_9ACTN|nr:ABC transporter substrate-binding protein [Gordonia mangrovi]MXP23347.1 ABC transporter substrate-binding protein [Gordonia mangrovi]UVF76742.1 ABC transporter substrate-binding protein [Gordonia mangrovi]